MPLDRISYWNLPPVVRNTIEETTGAVTSAAPVGAGLNSSVAAVVRTPQGRYFVKALPTDHRWVWTQAREAEIAPYLTAVAPALQARIVVQDWDVLVFEALHGSQADYTPGSADLDRVAHLLTRIGDVPCPDIELREASQRLQKYADEADLHHFAGPALLHTDLNNANIIVSADRARIVDWGWATRGAPWLDTAYWVIWLIAAGHEPSHAEKLAATVPSWQHASDNGIDAFAAANTRLWTEIAGHQPDPFTTPLKNAARRWHEYRTSLRR